MSGRDRITLEQLRKLEPLSSLSRTRLEELVPLTDIENLSIGHSLFREGDVDNQTIFLLYGDIQLTSSDGKVDFTFSHTMEEARFPLDDSQPRQLSATALSKVKLARVDNSVLEYMLMWDQMAVSEETQPASAVVPAPTAVQATADHAQPTVQQDTTVTPFPMPASPPPAAKPQAAEDGNWLRKIRQVMAFKNLPPANIRSLLERMETIHVHAGDSVVRQGDAGDYYYVLTEGEARVSRIVDLATLESGASFGEEALLSGGTRNATVTMTTDGSLMRLSKQDFDELLREPMVHKVAIEQAQQLLIKGARWLDVRYAKEYQHSRIPGAINIPLQELRARLDELDTSLPYICYCGTGRRSSAAAFLLSQKGFRASVLKGGTRLIPQELEKAVHKDSARRPVQGATSQ